MMKTVCVVFIVWFTMENFCASAQTNGPTHIPSDPFECNTGEFMCNNRQCIRLAFRCDGDIDCVDRSDEENCRGWLTTVSRFIYDNVSCGRKKIRCTTINKCIYMHWVCDGNNDCGDGSDEVGCVARPSRPSGGCRSDEFRCSIGNQCVLAEYQCDGDKDCLDNSDESGCNTTISPASTILTTTPFPTTPSSSFASVWQHSTKSSSTTPNGAHVMKTEKDTSGSEQTASHVQTEKEDKEYGYLDKINTLVAVIVGGVVVTVIVISVAVVLAKKKRSTKRDVPAAKIEEHYDMPNNSCNANNDNENVRTSNVYDFIPEPGDCSASNYTELEYTAAEESGYLMPVMEGKEAPYMTIPNYTGLENTTAEESGYLTPVMESKEAPYMTIP